MAWIFSLAIECGAQPPAQRCAEHFRSEAVPVPVEVDLEQSDEDGAWWANVIPIGESRSGVTSETVARSLTSAGRALLEGLRAAPPYRFALVGVEAFDAVSLHDLLTDAPRIERFHGLVVADEIRRRMHPALEFEDFEQGYVWLPYRGEKTSSPPQEPSNGPDDPVGRTS
ncbi:hypothetical protein OJ998_04440 [Solirubrobacter taibaiensis]|nr:hypothetical protein [Solirubrobacter taibaiensis]